MRYASSIAAIGLLMAAGGCTSSTVRDTLGLSRAAPDEFRVVSRPPLSVPPQFSLQPPSAGNQAPNQIAASDKAQALVTGSQKADTAVIPVTASTPAGTPGSGAESSFLQKAGATQADPQVRDKLAEERYAAQQQPEEDHWWNFFGSSKKEPVVDANKESQRIQTNQDSGQPVTTGDTATVKNRDTGTLGRIFGY